MSSNWYFSEFQNWTWYFVTRPPCPAYVNIPRIFSSLSNVTVALNNKFVFGLKVQAVRLQSAACSLTLIFDYIVSSFLLFHTMTKIDRVDPTELRHSKLEC